MPVFNTFEFQYQYMNETWIKHPIVLQGQLVELHPLEKAHLAELRPLTADKKLWEFYPADYSNEEKFNTSYNFSLAERDNGTVYPFVIRHKKSGKLIGSTRYLNIIPGYRQLEIGFSWIIQQYWGTAINFDCKLLLMTYAFETLNAVGVQLRTDENNIRSRTAIQKIGGKFEGILRKDRPRDNGTYRNTASFSILDSEWPEVREKIITQLNEKLAITI